MENASRFVLVFNDLADDDGAAHVPMGYLSRMDCPKCAAVMQVGRIQLVPREALAVAARITGRVHVAHVLSFAVDEDSEPVFPKLARDAFHCSGCDSVVWPGVLSDALECYDCGAVIPADADRCAACGWTW